MAMTCGLCKKPIRGDEHYTTDHYRCGVDMTRSWSDDVAILLAALKRAVETIRAFHGIGLHEADEYGMWELYQNSPEMQAINAAIAKVEGHTS